MPAGPQEQTRPTEAEQAALQTAGQLLGRKGGKTRAAKLRAKQRTAIAKQAAVARWGAKSAG